jgi:bifunctional DNase/RNase
MNMLEAKVEGLALDMRTETPVVVLAPTGHDKVLPIWIGNAEATAIAMELAGIPSRRPLTHELLKRILESLNARVDRVEITALKEQTFFAVIRISNGGEQQAIDARPSDSIAIALKTGASIFVNEELFDIKTDDDSPDATMPTDRETLRERLKKINPEDFGKYQL